MYVAQRLRHDPWPVAYKEGPHSRREGEAALQEGPHDSLVVSSRSSISYWKDATTLRLPGN